MRVLLILLLLIVPALAKDNGQWAKSSPAERLWFKEQKQPGTNFLCCDEADGELVDEEIRDGHYWIQSEKTRGKWMKVPDQVVIQAPNMHGRPVAWFRWLQGEPQIFCYAPGGGI